MIQPCLLMILDGWGIRESSEANAVALARTPHLDDYFRRCAHTRLMCSGEAVGLPEGTMGNSEVGHLNIGAGRIVYQELLRINNAIADGSFFTNAALVEAMQHVRKTGRTLHLLGLVSDGGVHSHIEHIKALLRMARQQEVPHVSIHAILDGRDTAPDSGIGFIRELQAYLEVHQYGQIATICGRYYAMDRDRRWDRTLRAYELYTQGQGRVAADPVQAVRDAYDRQETDEFVQPIVLQNKGPASGPIQDNDSLIFFNFRADRTRQITRAFTQSEFDGFARQIIPRLARFVCLTRYDETFDLPVAYSPVHLTDILGEIVSRHQIPQLRIAETEKYAHVTYFFNGGEEAPFAGEDRCLVASPRDVATYDLKPVMSAAAVTEGLLARMEQQDYGLIVLNFANMDMVGHTGVLEAAITACETVDTCIGRIVPAFLARGGAVIITADHGNAETMRDEQGQMHTAHTLNPVPLILINDRFPARPLRQGILADIAPTILALLGLPQPAAMTGKSLLSSA